MKHVKGLEFIQFYERFCSDILGVVVMVVCLSGRGDKDMQTVMNHMAAAEQDQEKLV